MIRAMRSFVYKDAIVKRPSRLYTSYVCKCTRNVI